MMHWVVRMLLNDFCACISGLERASPLILTCLVASELIFSFLFFWGEMLVVEGNVLIVNIWILIWIDWVWFQCGSCAWHGIRYFCTTFCAILCIFDQEIDFRLSLISIVWCLTDDTSERESLDGFSVLFPSFVDHFLAL